MVGDKHSAGQENFLRTLQCCMIKLQIDNILHTDELQELYYAKPKTLSRAFGVVQQKCNNLNIIN